MIVLTRANFGHSFPQGGPVVKGLLQLPNGSSRMTAACLPCREMAEPASFAVTRDVIENTLKTDAVVQWIVQTRGDLVINKEFI